MGMGAFLEEKLDHLNPAVRLPAFVLVRVRAACIPDARNPFNPSCLHVWSIYSCDVLCNFIRV